MNNKKAKRRKSGRNFSLKQTRIEVMAIGNLQVGNRFVAGGWFGNSGSGIHRPGTADESTSYFSLVPVIAIGVVAGCWGGGWLCRLLARGTPLMVTFQEADIFREVAKRVFTGQKARILAAIPLAQVEHVGGTAIPGCLTKGDLDINVRVRQEDFALAVEQLKRLYKIAQPDNWTEGFASFKGGKTLGMDVGVQLTSVGAPEDAFVRLRDILSSRPDLLARYNQMKTDHNGKSMDDYRAAKALFIQNLLRDNV